MKTKITLLIVGFTFLFCGNIFSQVSIQRVLLNGNNISAYFQTTGIFNQNTTAGNSPGFEWPKGTSKHAIFSSGLSIGAKVNGMLAQSMSSYHGEFAPGYIQNGIAVTNSSFKIYKISRGDNAGNNPDFANWYLMVPYGAPYIDVNNNHQYDPGVDSIGIRNASQVIFLCMTDGFAVQHTSGEGFGVGITNPLLNSRVALTAWCYDRSDLQEIQFIKWEIINSGTNAWNSTYMSIVCDPDLGYSDDDYIGCDTSKNLGYCYNSTNNDATYGANPPAVGMILHKSPKNFTSFNFFTNTSSAPPPCESDPNGEPLGAYNMMRGFKKDTSNFMNPLTTPPTPTKFVYSGDPQTNSGWTEFRGSVQNCSGNTGTIITVNPSGDRRFIMSSGADNYTVNPNDTVTIIASQLIARGSSNLNSVTALKNYASTAWSVFNGGFSVGIQKISSIVPTEFSLSQNYPNPFNPATTIKFSIPVILSGAKSKTRSGGNLFVKLSLYDLLGREVETLVNEKLNAGTYEVSFDASKLSSGIYFYTFSAGDYKETKRMVLIK